MHQALRLNPGQFAAVAVDLAVAPGHVPEPELELAEAAAAGVVVGVADEAAVVGVAEAVAGEETAAAAVVVVAVVAADQPAIETAD